MLSQGTREGWGGGMTAHQGGQEGVWGGGGQRLLTQGDKDVADLCAHHGAVALLVEDGQPLHVVLKAALVLVLGDGLHHGQELLEVQRLQVHLWGMSWGTGR